jgi:hypothetical protein
MAKGYGGIKFGMRQAKTIVFPEFDKVTHRAPSLPPPWGYPPFVLMDGPDTTIKTDTPWFLGEILLWTGL